MGATVTRNGKTYYKGDDGKLYANYNAARVAAEDRRNAGALQGLQDFFKRDRQSGYVGAVFPDPRRGVSGLSADPRVHNKPLSEDQLEALSKGQDEAITAYGSIPSSSLPPAPGLGAPDAYGDPAARAREAEQRRMMQQYASKEYWDTEQGKAMLSLGQQMTAPKDAKLADYYGAQRAVGIGSMDEILSGLASVDDRYKEGGDLRKWAEANQALALREYNKRFPGGTVETGGGELTAPTIDTANPTAGERALMEAKYALYGDPSAAPAAEPQQTPGGYKPDELVIGMNEQGQQTVGEGAYGFDPAFDQLPVAKRPVPAEANRAEAGSVVPVEAQKANELLERHKRGLTRGRLLVGN